MGIFDGIGKAIDFAPGQYKPKQKRIGAVAVVLVAIFLFTIYTRPSVPFLAGHGTDVKANLTFGANIRPGYTPVRVHGVEVGQVTKVSRGPSGRGAQIVMEIKKGTGVKLHQDVSLAVRWRTLLGRNLYVDLDEGSPSAPKWDGGIIPSNRTQDQVELDTVLEPFDAKGRKSLQTMITEFDKGFSDPKALSGAVANGGASMVGGKALSALRGEDPTNINKSVNSGSTTLSAGSKGLPGLRGENAGDLPRLVRNTSHALGQLDSDEAALGGLVTNGAGALGVTAARSADFATTLNTAPRTLQTTRTTLTRLTKTLDIVDPLAKDLKPGLKQLPSTANKVSHTLDITRPLLGDLRPTLALLRPALTDLRTASRNGVPAFKPLNATMTALQDQFVPFLKRDDPASHRPNYQNLGPLISTAGSATSWGDRFGALANFEATVGEDVFDDPCKLEITNPDVPADKKVQCELIGMALASATSGKPPASLQMKNQLLPDSVLKPFIDGTKSLPGIDNVKGLTSIAGIQNLAGIKTLKKDR